MNYKSYEKDKKSYFKYFPKRNKTLNENKQFINKNNPFKVLKEISFK